MEKKDDERGVFNDLFHPELNAYEPDKRGAENQNPRCEIQNPSSSPNIAFNKNRLAYQFTPLANPHLVTFLQGKKHSQSESENEMRGVTQVDTPSQRSWATKPLTVAKI